VISYRGFHAHYLRPTPYAYSRLEGENVVEVREKGSFTDNRENEYASCGAYYFRTAALLRAALEFQFENQVQCNGEYYTSLTVQALLLQDPKADVRVFEIPYFCQWGTPEDLQRYEYWERSYQSYLRYSKPKEQVHVGQVMIPMAGAGSRFKSVTPVLKPFIPVGARPMYEEAISTLPRSENVVIVALESFEEEIKKSSLGKKIRPTFLKETPSGQALSVEAGIKGLDLEQEVLISSCDHGIVLNPDLWRKFAEAPNCDAAIFTIQGFPGASERPNAFAYVVPKQKLENSLFLQVERVSVKRPVSANPSQDHLLVGTFWFKNGKILQKGIEELKKRDIRVNSELYLDSVFECLMEMGHSVRMIPLDGYLCWGDPDSLAETLYWKEFFACTPIEKRKRYPGVQNR
jgi:NDP-sugar pyrophosphorylase family protein